MPWEFLGFRTCLFHELQETCFFMLNQKGYFFMLKLASTVAVLAVLSVAASAQTNVQVLTAVPRDSVTVSNWYKQSVYDPSDAKVGAVNDVLTAPTLASLGSYTLCLYQLDTVTESLGTAVSTCTFVCAEAATLKTASTATVEANFSMKKYPFWLSIKKHVS